MLPPVAVLRVGGAAWLALAIGTGRAIGAPVGTTPVGGTKPPPKKPDGRAALPPSEGNPVGRAEPRPGSPLPPRDSRPRRPPGPPVGNADPKPKPLPPRAAKPPRPPVGKASPEPGPIPPNGERAKGGRPDAALPSLPPNAGVAIEGKAAAEASRYDSVPAPALDP